MFDRTVNPMKDCFAYSRSFEVKWLYEGYFCWFPYNTATGELSPVPPHSVGSQKQAIHESSFTRKVWEVPVRFGKYWLMTMPGARCAAKAACVQPDDPPPLHRDDVYKGVGDRDATHAEQIWDAQNLCEQSAGGVSALQQIQVLDEKAGLEVPTTVLKAEKLLAQRLAAILENSILSSVLTFGPEAFKMEKEALLSKVSKWKNELASELNNEFTAKLGELRPTCYADVGALERKMQKNEKRADR